MTKGRGRCRGGKGPAGGRNVSDAKSAPKLTSCGLCCEAVKDSKEGESLIFLQRSVWTMVPQILCRRNNHAVQAAVKQ